MDILGEVPCLSLLGVEGLNYSLQESFLYLNFILEVLLFSNIH